jgi:acetylornithine/N-succinyldiaminopimelate aminotransferase
MAVGNAVLDVILEPGFLEEVQRKSLLFKQQLASVIDAYPEVLQETRGRGLMLGLKCVRPNTEVLAKVRANGLLVVPAGDNVLRILPPLTITDAEIGEAVARIEAAAKAVAADLAAEKAGA